MSLLAVCACTRTDPLAQERIVVRDQLRREVSGLRALEAIAPGKLMDRQHEVLVSVTDTLLKSLIDEAFPVTVRLPNQIRVTFTSATVAFRANVARVDIVGQVQRTKYPHVSAAMRLRGALDKFVIDSSHQLQARISIDDVLLDTPTGTPDAFDPYVIGVLQSVVSRSLPELTASLPSVAVPVRLDQDMRLPGFGPEGALTVQPSIAPLTVAASRVIAFQNRLWIILRIELGAFATVAQAAP